jgi:drug/metabolite transporter (DMT)-like permease
VGGDDQPALLPSLAILLSSFAWAVGSLLSKRLTLPSSRLISAGSQMFAGGLVLLLLSLALREAPPLPHWSGQAILALAYLVVAGSLVAFTAYSWLLHHLPTTQVASYAYVNPVIALALGHWFGSESFGWRAVFGAVLILVSVAAILRHQGKSKQQ